MRPVRRGDSPQQDDFDPYAKAQPFLISRLGPYCSYCERRISTSLAVEHIQPKGLPAFAHLEGSWENYLLACVNCNSTKKDKNVVLQDILLPDRDNTFAAYAYTKDGRVVPSQASIAAGFQAMASATLKLTGLDRQSSVVVDENGKEIALDRAAQRKEVWLVAIDASNDIAAEPESQGLRNATVRTALGYGFFSIWMAAFSNDLDMRLRFIKAFSGTEESGCFDAVTTQLVSPAPNPDGLVGGAKL
ncbi:HNH endonuclease [Paraburkholderia tropica]|uniref:HNH endonuclease n=1 Tax=Paraburkholderia tropica TaxID=92647 RepID=UPI002AAF22F1|nr:HNH endonuclease [Paraburkholderia tropica]